MWWGSTENYENMKICKIKVINPGLPSVLIDKNCTYFLLASNSKIYFLVPVFLFSRYFILNNFRWKLWINR